MSNFNPTPQFGTAEYAGVSGTEHCRICKQPIGRRYYRVNQGMACAACGERMQHDLPADSHGRFVRGLIFGIGAAILGLVLYATFEIATGLIVGYVSLAVGFIVGRGIKMGSRGAGGRKYQIAAVALTYAAVALAAIPIYISAYAKAGKALDGEAILQLLFNSLASPFVELQSPVHGLIGLVILFVGIKIAWRLTAGTEVQITGPFDNASAATA